MDRRRVIKGGLGLAVGIAFVGALIGIVLTGPIVVPQPQLSLDVAPSGERLRAFVKRLCDDFGPRDAENVEGLDGAADWIATEFRSAGLETSYQEYSVANATYRNVIGFRPGTTQERSLLVVGAHYDAFPGSPGADNNASGIAVLLELVRSLPAAAPRLGQYFVAFSTHEPPFLGTPDMGSAHFAARLAQQDADVRLMIALDRVGYFSSEPGSQRVPFPLVGLLYPDRGNFIAVSANLGNGLSIRRVKQAIRAMREVPVHSFRAPAWLDRWSDADHASFWEQGFPAVLITDTGTLRNPHDRLATDLPATLDYLAMARVVRSVHAVLWNNGGAPLLPDPPS